MEEVLSAPFLRICAPARRPLTPQQLENTPRRLSEMYGFFLLNPGGSAEQVAAGPVGSDHGVVTRYALTTAVFCMHYNLIPTLWRLF